jgi:hypothetical protein
LQAAERGYQHAVDILTALHARGAIQGTDVQLLETSRAELARIRTELENK